MKVLAAWLVCLSMITGLAVLVPGDASAAPPEGTIKGWVSDGTNPLPNSYILAMAWMGGGGMESTTSTDAEGNYTLNVTGGLDYMLMAFNNSCYAGSGMVRVLSGQTVWLNFTLDNIAPTVADVTLKGYVTDEFGAPVSNGNIGGFSNDPATMGEGAPLYVNMTKPDGAGYYSVNVIPSIAGGGIAALDFPGYPFIDNGTNDPLVSGMTYWFNITLEPQIYADDATLSGTVTERGTGLPIENVLVMYETWNETTEQGYSNRTWTDATGYYFMNVTNGSYARVVMSLVGYSMFVMEGLEVLPGEDEVLDASLAPTTATVRGNVTDLSTGDPLPNAWVFLFDMNGTMNMAISNSSGAYILDAFDGTDLILGAEADGYSRNVTWNVTINPGDLLWWDFGLRPIDAWLTGKVLDAFSSAPVANASMSFHSPDYDEWTESNATGDYNVSLVSGEYSVDIYGVPGYRDMHTTVTVSSGANLRDFGLTPWDIPDTVRLWGYVNNTGSGSGIFNATVEVGTGSPDYMERNSTRTLADGSYEMWIPPIELIVVAHAVDNTHGQSSINASGMTDVRLDFVLVTDLWGPNLTYTQSATENVSMANPTWIYASAQEFDAQQISLWQFMMNGSAGIWDYYYGVETRSVGMHPLEQSQNDLPYSIIGDSYVVSYWWSAQPRAGWLSNTTDQVYLQLYEIWWGPDLYWAFRGEYVNSTMAGPEEGTAWFDGATHAFAFFTFDNGSLETAYPSDPTGVVIPYVALLRVESGTANWNWLGIYPIGAWSVVDTEFVSAPSAPSGGYATLYFIGDWGGRGAIQFELFTVDNDPPVADAGPGQDAIEGVTVTLDGSMSSDNVGIVTYQWTFDDGGLVLLFGESVDYAFTTTGNHTITLTVWDGANLMNSDSTWVDVAADQLPVADAGPDQDVDDETLVTFDGSGSTDDVGIVNYTWTILELSQELYDVSPQFTFTVPGVYNVELVVEDTAGQLSAPDTMVVTVIDVTPPTANAGDDQVRMGGELVVLNASGSWDDVGIVNWTWTFDYEGTPYTLWGEEVSFVFWTEGVYNITLNVTDAAGNWNTDEVQITISGIIPEFPTVLIPIVGAVVLVLLVRMRTRRR